MDNRLFGILVLLGWIPFTSSLLTRQYKLIAEPSTWLDARRYCRDQHTDLATINSEEDLEVLTSLAKPGSSNIFVGLYKNWGWSLSDADGYKAGEQTFWKWMGGEPLEQPYHCGSIGETGEWVGTDCSSRLNFTCYDESSPVPSERFTLWNLSMDWLAAQSYCRQQHTDLALVRNQLENEELQAMAMEDQLWIGLTRTSWEWSDGSETSFVPWSLMEPSSGLGDCAVLMADRKPLAMKANDCAQKLPFFCYTDAVKRYVVQLNMTADSSVNMMDPAVMESILELMRTKLSEQGATVAVKMSWKKPPEKEIIKKERIEAIRATCVP